MLLQGLTTDWAITAQILIQVIFWALFTGSVVRLDLNYLKHLVLIAVCGEFIQDGMRHQLW